MKSEDFPPTNYSANVGDAYSAKSSKPANGLFQGINTGSSLPFNFKYIGLENVRDGLSHTCAFSEWLLANKRLHDRRRWHYSRNTPFPIAGWDRELFAERCLSLDKMSRNFTSDIEKGNGWAMGAWFTTLHDHFLPPNAPSCINSFNSSDLYGTATASSQHPGGVYTTFADGHVQFIHDTVSISVWRALGTRDFAEVISSEDY